MKYKHMSVLCEFHKRLPYILCSPTRNAWNFNEQNLFVEYETVPLMGPEFWLDKKKKIVFSNVLESCIN